MATKLNFILAIAGLLVGCTPPPPKEINWRTFDSKRAYDHVKTLVGFGPRPAGSMPLTKAASYITSQLEECGLEAPDQSFMAGTPRSSIQFRNIIGKVPGGRGETKSIIVVAAHYDTKYLPNMNFVGANDGGSGAGVLLEIARCAAGTPDIWFVFFDGEEAIKEYTEQDGLVGSRAFIEHLKGDGQLGQIKAMILLDMVGDANLKIDMPANSTGKLVEHVFEAARDVGYRDFFGLGKKDLLDDHVPFLRAGIPAVDLIDFEFGSAPGRNDYWHTDKDTLDKISPRSLEIVGKTTLRLLAKLRAGAPVR